MNLMAFTIFRSAKLLCNIKKNICTNRKMKMPQITWNFGRLGSNLKHKIKSNIHLCELTRKTLFYNSFTSVSTVMDTLMEPLFWFVDHTVRYLGPLFVLLVVALTLSVVVIFYICLLPQIYEENFTWTCIHLVFGHYFLVCIVFHYFKAAFTDPGRPPEKVEEVVSICKRCIAPKPPRSHHCSICKKCVLKMDHHCPWLNNCVGHNNHRYFLLFCLYMWIGTVYVSATAYPLFKVHFYGVENPGPSGFAYPFYLLKKQFFSESIKSPIEDAKAAVEKDAAVKVEEEIVLPTRDTTGLTFHGLIIYEFLLCSAVSFALGILLLWHCRLISYGETSIEWHLNKREANRMKKKGQVYKNPYDFGIIKNWQRFLGIHRTGRFWKRVLLPSSHTPDEDGIHWNTSTYSIDQGLLLL